MLIGTICCSFRLFLFVFVGSTLLFSPVPVRKLHDVASFFGGGPLSTEVICPLCTSQEELRKSSRQLTVDKPAQSQSSMSRPCGCWICMEA